MNLICDGIWKRLVRHGKRLGTWQFGTLSLNSTNMYSQSAEYVQEALVHAQKYGHDKRIDFVQICMSTKQNMEIYVTQKSRGRGAAAFGQV